jgi:geranylgeranyl pyrophosphate synthase
MDDSCLRRGVPTCHKVYGDAMAILTGDAFLTLAFEMVARFGLKEGCAERSVNIATLLAQSAGVKGMVGGQVLDLLAEGKKLDLNQIETIAALKTGALLRASVKCGALASGASRQQLELLDRYGKAVGTAFQIIDDLLDYEGKTEETGKPVGIDQERGKATYPALIGKESAREKAKALYNDALAALEDLDCPTDLLAALARMLVFRVK